MPLFAQFSFLFATIPAGMLLAVALWRWRQRSLWLRAGIFAWYVFAVLIIGLLFRYPATPVQTPADVERILANGRPSFVMLYSNFCMGCMGALPTVQAILPDLQAANFNVVLLDVNTQPARDMLARFGFYSTPTFIVYAAGGQEIRRSAGLMTLAEIIEA